DFVVRSTHSIEHQKCKYCVGRALTKGLWIKIFVKALPNAIAEPLGNISCTFTLFSRTFCETSHFLVALFAKLHTF
ncbi:hypothetical protein, partial [Prevotella sp.]|uniref:hypothetical protein n=1 Tax=Prevotella sp. TaxID=59823 RepID=UPI00307B2DF1